jgi:hypothetical protein
MSNTIKITENNEVQLPIYVKKRDGEYLAVMGPVEGTPVRYREVSVRAGGTYTHVSTYCHMDAADAIKAIMGGEQVTREEFTKAFAEAEAFLAQSIAL